MDKREGDFYSAYIEIQISYSPFKDSARRPNLYIVYTWIMQIINV